jgi:hypothetical protein
MKVVVHNPPLMILLMAIALDFPVNRSAERRIPGERGWLSRQVIRFLRRRDSITRRA